MGKREQGREKKREDWEMGSVKRDEERGRAKRDEERILWVVARRCASLLVVACWCFSLFGRCLLSLGRCFALSLLVVARHWWLSEGPNEQRSERASD